LIFIPEGTFFVDHGCSGQGQLIVALVVGCIYTYLHPMKWRTRFVLILSAVLTAIITNVFRIYIVVMSGHYTNMQHYFVTVDHVALGWVVFAIGMLIYFISANWFLDTFENTSTNNPTIALIDFQPDFYSSTQSKAPYITILLAVLAISIGPSLSQYLKYKVGGNSADTILTSLPDNIGGWVNITQSESPITSSWNPSFIGHDSLLYGEYKNIDDQRLELHIFKYHVQHQGKEAVSDSNSLFDEDTWGIVSKNIVKFDIDQEQMSLDAIVIRPAYGSRKLVLRWYTVLGVRTRDPIIAKLLNIWGTITHRPDISAYVIVIDIEESYEDTLHSLQQFILDNSKLEIETK
jgi:EpsI family protein